MKEKTVEQHLIIGVKSLGGMCLKLRWMGGVGFPDRVCLFFGGQIAFVEIKRPRGFVIGPHQRTWKTNLQRLGFQHAFLHTLEQVDAFLDTYKTL